MKNFLVFSDLHAHNFKQFSTVLPNGVNSRLQNTLDIISQITQLCKDNKIEGVFFTGDLFHSRTKIDVDVYSYTWYEMRKLAQEVHGNLYILVGNHDQYSKIGDVHSLESFKDFATVIDAPIVKRVGNLRFAAHPFTTDIQAWKDFTSIIPNVDIFFFHQGST